MQKRPPGSAKTKSPSEGQNPAIEVRSLGRHIADFICECEYKQHTKRTLQEERAVLAKFLGYLTEANLAECGASEIRAYLTHVASGGLQRGGRWGQQEQTPVRPRTVRNHWGYLRTFFNWLSEEHPSITSPFDRIRPPIVRADQIRPFTAEQIEGLKKAAKASNNPQRDYAIVLFLLDTGVRASELCAIRILDLDLGGHRCTVLGKGNKHRVIFFGRETKKALSKYLHSRSAPERDPLFVSTRGKSSGDPFTRDGLQQLIGRLGKVASLSGVRCSPHTFRHTAAINFLSNGGNVFALQQLLGHTDLGMTQRYLNLTTANLEAQARQFSPVDNLTRKATSDEIRRF